MAQNCVDGDVALRHEKFCTKEYGVTPQRTVLFIVTAVTTSNLTRNAGHIVFVHFEDTFPSIKLKARVALKSGWLFKGEEQIREENRRKRYSSSTMESLNDVVCGDGADYQFSIYFLLSSLLSPCRQYPNAAHFSSSVCSLYEQMGIQILTAVT